MTKLFTKNGYRTPYILGHRPNPLLGRKRGHRPSPLLGRKLTEEHKKKLVEAHKGRIYPRGRITSEETKRKIGLGNKGKSAGSKNYFYKGGFRKARYPRGSHEVKEWRRKVFERDEYACQQCGGGNGAGYSVYLEAHHIFPYSKLINTDFAKHIYNTDNGLTLCHDCHRTITSLQQRNVVHNS